MAGMNWDRVRRENQERRADEADRWADRLSRTEPKIITAKYRGRCRECDTYFDAGTDVVWDPATRATQHIDCSVEVSE